MSTIDRLPLRTLLRLDAATCAVMGAALTLASTALSGLLGIPTAVLLPAGLALFPIAAFMLVAAKGRATAARLVVAGNAAWVLASLALALVVRPTPAGVAFVLLQAFAVAVLAALEWRALAREGAADAGTHGTMEHVS